MIGMGAHFLITKKRLFTIIYKYLQFSTNHRHRIMADEAARDLKRKDRAKKAKVTAADSVHHFVEVAKLAAEAAVKAHRAAKQFEENFALLGAKLALVNHKEHMVRSAKRSAKAVIAGWTQSPECVTAAVEAAELAAHCHYESEGAALNAALAITAAVAAHHAVHGDSRFWH